MGEKQDLENSFMTFVENLIQQELKKLKFNYTLTGKITTVVDSVNYKVLINEFETKAKAINGATYIIGDIVYILVPNNNLSNKIILCKVP